MTLHSPVIATRNFQQGGSATLRARLSNPGTSATAEGTPYTAADVQAITCTVFAGANPVPEWHGVSVDPASVMLASLQPWSLDGRPDDPGYNFSHAIGPEAFPTGNVAAKVLYVVDLVDGTRQWFEFIGPVRAMP